MPIKDILVHLAPGLTSQPDGPMAYAIGMAKIVGANLTSLTFTFDFTKPVVFYGDTPDQDIEGARKRFRLAAEDATAIFVNNARHAGIPYETVIEESFSYAAADIINDYAKLRDLTICCNNQMGLLSGKGIAEHLIFASGRPVVIVPRSHSQPFSCDRIMVAWDYSRAAVRSTSDALPLLKMAKHIFVVTVSDDKGRMSNRSSHELARHFARHSLEVTVEEISDRGGPIDQLLLAHANAQQADLIVMGGYGHSRLREFVLGGATGGMLQNADRPVLMSH